MIFNKIILSFTALSVVCAGSACNANIFDSNFHMRRVQIEGAAASTLMSLGLVFLGKKLFASMPPASDQTTQFVQMIGDQYGIPHDYDIKVGAGDAAGKGTIIVEQAYNDISSIDLAIHQLNTAETPEQEQAAQKKIYEHIGILDHEFGHYKNNDATNALIVTALFNISTTAAYLALEQLFFSEKVAKLTNKQKERYGLISGSGLALIHMFFNFWYRVRFEKRADEHVRNHPDVLKAMVAWTQRIQNDIKTSLKTHWLGKKFAAALEKYPALYYLMDPVHPPLPAREARFKERLAELETAQENASVVNS